VTCSMPASGSRAPVSLASRNQSALTTVSPHGPRSVTATTRSPSVSAATGSCSSSRWTAGGSIASSTASAARGSCPSLETKQAPGFSSGAARAAAVEKGSALTDPLRRDLFERHLPESARRKTLGLTFDRAALVARKGDAAAGAVVFRALCGACHRHGDEGREFGPDLSRIAAKYPRADLLAHIIEPAKEIDPAWHLTVVEMKDGTTHGGFVTARTDAGLTLRIADGSAREIAVSDVAKSTATRLSLMPEGLLAGLTADEAAGLLDFLLKTP